MRKQHFPIIPVAWLGDSEFVKKQWLVDEPIILSCSLGSPDALPSWGTENQRFRISPFSTRWRRESRATRNIYRDIILASIGLSFWSFFIRYVFQWQLLLCCTVYIESVLSSYVKNAAENGGVYSHALEGHCTWQTTTMVRTGTAFTTVWEQSPPNKPIAKHQKWQSCWKHFVKRQRKECWGRQSIVADSLEARVGKAQTILGRKDKIIAREASRSQVFLGPNDHPMLAHDGPNTSNNPVREQRLCFWKFTLNLIILPKSHDLRHSYI